jgi:O-antigen/teichoic acid export membrane protein
MTGVAARSSRETSAELPLGRSFGSNLGGVAWTAAMQLAFTPLFIRCVGVEGYGLIGFYVTLQALLQVLDFGFAPSINRWLSRYSAGHEEAQRSRDVAKTLEIGSGAIALGAGTVLIALAGTVARLWARNTTVGEPALRLCLMMMAATMTAQLPTTYYQSGLLGLRRPLEMNVLKALAATVSTAGTALILTLFSSTVPAYFAMQSAAAILHVVVLRTLFWRSMGATPGEPGHFRPQALRTAWRFTAGMTVIAMCAALVAQVDRVILSRLVSLQDFGYYALAWVVASGLAVVSLPALNTLFPRLSGLFASGDDRRLRDGYHRGAQALSVLLLPLASVVALFSLPIMTAWTGNTTIARNASQMATPLVIGMALNGLMAPVYALQLAVGATRLALKLTIGQIVVIVPLVTVLAIRYGIVGAAFAWPAVNVLYFSVGSAATFRRFLQGAGREWILRDVGAPFAAAIGCAAAARAFVPLPADRFGTLLVVGGVLVCSTVASALSTRTTRAAMLRFVGRDATRYL